MGKIVIKKRISLEFIGEEYADGYFIFKSIPLSEYDKLTSDLDSIKDDNKKAIPFILAVLKDHFVEGKFPNDANELEEIGADDLEGIDQPTCLEIFQRLTGQGDPKVEGQLPTS
jgi:hypothetical protein